MISLYFLEVEKSSFASIFYFLRVCIERGRLESEVMRVWNEQEGALNSSASSITDIRKAWAENWKSVEKNWDCNGSCDIISSDEQ